MAIDTYALAPRYAKFLRVTDVADGLDAVGRADLTLLDRRFAPVDGLQVLGAGSHDARAARQ
jgi:hypothetical protein